MRGLHACLWSLLAVVLVAVLATMPSARAQSGTTAPKRLRVMMVDNYPPFVFVGDNGKLRGYSVDQWQLFAAHTGVQVVLTAASWNTASEAVLAGKADVVDPVYRNAERESRFDFTPPYAGLPASIYVTSRALGVTDVAALRRVTVGVARASICANELDRLGVTTQRRFPDPVALIQAAVAGQVSVFCMDENRTNYYARQFPELIRFDRSFVLQTGEFHWAARKGNTATLKLVWEGMGKITPAEQETLRQRWLTRPPAATVFERMAGIALIAVLAVVALMLLWVWALHRSVGKRTARLRAEENKLRAILDASPFAIWVKDLHGVYQDCNEQVLRNLGLPREAIIGHTDLELFGPERTAELREMDAHTVHDGKRQSWFMTLDFDQLGERQLAVVNVPLRNEKDQPYGTLGTGRDVTDEKHAEAELRLAAVAFQTQEALLVMDDARCVQRVNQAFEKLTGFAAADIVGQPSTFIRSTHHEPAFFTHLWAQVGAEGFWQGEYWVRVKHGRPRVVRLAVSAVHDGAGAVTHYLASMVDLTAERDAHASVDHMTFFDPLTDLPNRHYLRGRLRHVLEEPAAANNAVLIIDLDHFKRINDLRGHAIGDWLLTQVAQRLRHVVDANDVLSRFGGGTFALLAGGAAGAGVEERAWRSAEQVRLALREPFVLDGGMSVVVTASIGWTRLAPGVGSADTVLKEAELAMYEAKAGGRDQARRYAPAMQRQLELSAALVHDLRNAVADGALELHLQAQTNRAGHIVGAEGLLRWTRPGGERVPPSVFIPVAEENGLVVALGTWVLQRAGALLARWAAAPATSDLALAVNVSAKQFARADFVAIVRDVLAASGADPSRLKLELTESAILDDLDEAADKLSQLRALGMRISLDDFGTGYSSLAYLSRLPLDQLKIDQSFVARLPDSSTDAMVARTIIGMGRGLGMEVIAEGVETVAQHDFLMRRGCSAFQGYLISRPVPLEAFEALLAAAPAVTSPADS